jgi:hypothetical protein
VSYATKSSCLLTPHSKKQTQPDKNGQIKPQHFGILFWSTILTDPHFLDISPNLFVKLGMKE